MDGVENVSFDRKNTVDLGNQTLIVDSLIVVDQIVKDIKNDLLF